MAIENGKPVPTGNIGKVFVSLKELIRDGKANEAGTCEMQGELELMGMAEAPGRERATHGAQPPVCIYTVHGAHRASRCTVCALQEPGKKGKPSPAAKSPKKPPTPKPKELKRGSSKKNSLRIEPIDEEGGEEGEEGEDDEEEEEALLSLTGGCIWLTIVTVLIAMLSESLTNTLQVTVI